LTEDDLEKDESVEYKNAGEEFVVESTLPNSYHCGPFAGRKRKLRTAKHFAGEAGYPNVAGCAKRNRATVRARGSLTHCDQGSKHARWMGDVC